MCLCMMAVSDSLSLSLCLATCQPSHHSLSFFISHHQSLPATRCPSLHLWRFIIMYYYLSSSAISINQSLCIIIYHDISLSIMVCHSLSCFFHCLSTSISAYHYLCLPIILYLYPSDLSFSISMYAPWPANSSQGFSLIIVVYHGHL